MTTQTQTPAVDLLPAFKEALGDDGIGVPDDNLLLFLNWKPNNIQRATERFRSHLKWRRENHFAFTNLQASQDDELKRLICSDVLIAPDNLTDKIHGGSVLIGRLRNNDMQDGRTVQGVGRMIFYLMDRVLERPETQKHGVTIFHDLKGFSTKNLDISIPKMIFGAIIGNFPIRINAIYILNVNAVFRSVFAVLSKLLFTTKLRERIKFVASLDEIYQVIDKDKLLVEHGGKLEFDSKIWIQEQMKREKDGTMKSLKNCLPNESY